ncbi:hypothetical protein XELAEV_18012733mg [Xenopus laevis]|uniref:Uncharacterized protein n=1 Tax=Xenopus laevis TaxID=8355 RepID=A0A974DPB8_XENLA|nr:hypothetical protein XELAEV_18012733mg [Xenopus laevis]
MKLVLEYYAAASVEICINLPIHKITLYLRVFICQSSLGFELRFYRMSKIKVVKKVLLTAVKKDFFQ